MQRFKSWLSTRSQHQEERLDNLVNAIAHELWLERTGGTQENISPEEAERLAALQDRQTAEKIAANPIRKIVWSGGKQLKAFTQSEDPILKFVRFFVWEIPKWNITALKLFLQSDIVKLLAVPVVAAILTTTTTISERREREQVETFDEYLNQIDKLMLEHGLLSDKPDPGAVVLARGRTVATLRKLDLKRRRELIAFIQASGLHRGEEAVISFEGANLRKLDFQDTDLSDFNFKAADLSGANFEGAILWRVNMAGASLFEAKLQNTDLWEANLEGAELQRASLEKANLNGTNLEEAWFCDTTMDDGEVNDDGCFIRL